MNLNNEERRNTVNCSNNGIYLINNIINLKTKIMSTTIKTEQRILNLETISGTIKLSAEVRLSLTGEIINASTGIKIAGILGTPAIKELGMIIDLKRGIITIKN